MPLINETSTQLAFWGIMSHMVADWIFQNDWIARNKSRFGNAMWLHAIFHLFAMLLIFPAPYAVIIVLIHVIVDTRIPLRLWQRFYRQTTVGEMAVHVAIWEDQVFHWCVICLVALWLGSH